MATRPWKEIKNKHMSPERQARVKERVEREMLAMTLAELRQQIAGLTQVQVAQILDTTQGAISQLEHREEMLLGNLADYVKALGGKLELVAWFPDGREVRISQFDEVKEKILASAS